MKNLIAIMALLALTGCSSMYKYIPSFWDDNQSHYMAELRLAVDRLDCQEPHAPQVLRIKDSVDIFMFYSESKGRLQQDVIKLVEPMKATVDDFYKRSKEKEGSVTYCNLKKKILTEQSQRAAGSVMGRF